ncbi:hypothetical protein [Actinoplanes derwentensis]|uniref:hypothetical protein n=1 Tax=Actinoplanes derwentensis TaxID=113562 RepID=UPI001EF17DB0|nr:hypothetical protein [Actinoplanes derwentensis]
MDTAVDVIMIGTLAAAWLAAGLLSDALPTARTAHQLRRRAGLVTALIIAGLAVFIAVPLVATMLPGVQAAPTAALLPAIPGLLVVAATVRRLGRVRRGAGAFTTAPLTPIPPGLRAAAAHPLLAAPLQVTGLAALVGLPIAAGLVTLPAGESTGVAGFAVLGIALAIAGIGVRAALRHNRLAPLVLATIDRERVPAGVR